MCKQSAPLSPTKRSTRSVIGTCSSFSTDKLLGSLKYIGKCPVQSKTKEPHASHPRLLLQSPTFPIQSSSTISNLPQSRKMYLNSGSSRNTALIGCARCVRPPFAAVRRRVASQLGCCGCEERRGCRRPRPRVEQRGLHLINPPQPDRQPWTQKWFAKARMRVGQSPCVAPALHRL